MAAGSCFLVDINLENNQEIWRGFCDLRNLSIIFLSIISNISVCFDLADPYPPGDFSWDSSLPCFSRCLLFLSPSVFVPFSHMCDWRVGVVWPLSRTSWWRRGRVAQVQTSFGTWFDLVVIYPKEKLKIHDVDSRWVCVWRCLLLFFSLTMPNIFCLCVM